MLILKVLNGPLFGVEFALPDEECFIRVVDLDVQAVYPDVENALDASTSHAVLTIPLPGRSPNFTLKLVSDGGESEVLRTVVFDDEEGMVECNHGLNVPLVIGELRIAVRQSNDLWSEDVLQHRRPMLPVPVGEAVSAPLPRRKWLARSRAAAIVILGCLGVLAAAWFFWPSPAPVQSVARLLAGVPGTVLEDQGGAIHVVADHDQGAGAIRRTLQRAGSESTVRVVTKRREVDKIEQLLDEAGVRHFAVRMADPSRPVLMLMDPLPTDVKRRLLGAAPYVKDFDVRLRSGDEAQSAANELIRNLGLNANASATEGRFVVSINDHLTDTQLDALGRALEVFRTKWGDRYVHFVINQRDVMQVDGIKTGEHGYELRGIRHLYFGS